MGGNRCQMVERGCVSPTGSPHRVRVRGGLTRTTRWVDKATHMGGSVIALEVLESRYWVRSIFCLHEAANEAPQWRCRTGGRGLSYLRSARFGLRTASGRLSAACDARRRPAASGLAFDKIIFLPGHNTRSFEVFSLGSEGGQ